MVDPRNAYFDEIYDAVFHKVKKLVIAKCRNLADVEDILQETFLEFYTLLCKKGVEYIKNAEALVTHIAKTKIHRHYKLLFKIRNLTLYSKDDDRGEWYGQDLDEINLEQKYINRQTVDEVWEYITKKPILTQKVFVLYFYEQLGIKEIAEQLKIGESNVKHRLYRTLSEIRGIYCKEV
ncbi:MAG: RNA polymerase sigma factor [Christensenellales bacterium]|jgi:RNA polymerase sigma factor (sigma-70 family)